MAFYRTLIAVSCSAIIVGAILTVVPASGASTSNQKHALAQPKSAPVSPPVEVCGNSSFLTGPSKIPVNAVRVVSGNNASLDLDKPDTTYWFAPGVHTLGNGQFSQVIPSHGDTYIGAPHAVISGQFKNLYAFTQNATDVTIEYLTIEDFGPSGSNYNMGVVNHDSASGWKIEHDTIKDNAGAGVMLGSGDVVEFNCLTRNGQYGFSSYLPSPGPHDITVSHNEISYNDTYAWNKKTQCGCAGGGKFWDSEDVTFTDNYVHNQGNLGDPGVWFDTDNRGIDVAGNYIDDNNAEGLIIEISYDASVVDNTFIHNGTGYGPSNPSFPTPAIYVSESGSDPQVGGSYSTQFLIKGNVIENNWSGVVLWENSNRFCGPGSPDNAGTLCTLVDPSVANVSTCLKPLIALSPLFTYCRWRTVNVDVTQNSFEFSKAAVGSTCSSSDGCGFNGIFSEYGSTAPYKAWVVPKDISDEQDNHFSDNTYKGPWSFMAVDLGVKVSWSQWTKGFTDNSDGSGIHFDPQDSGSKINQSGKVKK